MQCTGSVQFHVDGIRMDAVASMLYLDYGKQDGEWVANMYGGNENLEAIAFLQHINDCIHKEKSGVMTIAEESTAWPQCNRGCVQTAVWDLILNGTWAG